MSEAEPRPGSVERVSLLSRVRSDNTEYYAIARLRTLSKSEPAKGRFDQKPVLGELSACVKQGGYVLVGDPRD